MKARNLIYRKNEIDMEIEHPIFGWIPFTASADDSEQLGKDLYQKASSGELGEILPDDTDYTAISQAEFRAERDNLLKQADIEINIGLDNGIDVSALRTYRQELRDATVTWVLPTHP